MKKRNGKSVTTQLTEKEFIEIIKLCEKSGSTVAQILRGLIRYALVCEIKDEPLRIHRGGTLFIEKSG